MITVISPAKKIDLKSENRIPGHSTPAFLDKSALIIGELRKFAPTDLAVMMNVSSDIANLTFERISQWETPFSNQDSLQALLSFKGDVYRGIDAGSFTPEDFEFSQDHLRIISGLYGLLRPLDLIQPYRLEMGSSIRLAGDKSLYRFWTNTLTSALNREIEKRKVKVLINLSSQEYFKAINANNLRAKIITPVFKENRNDKYKVVGILAKKARGLMTRFIIKKRIADPENLKLFSEEGYTYDDNLSSETEWVFTR